MSSQMIKLPNGMLIEAQASDKQMRPISSKGASPVQLGLDQVKPLLLEACIPISEFFSELNEKMNVEQVELELGFGFEAKGSLFITQATAKANFKVKAILKPKRD